MNFVHSSGPHSREKGSTESERGKERGRGKFRAETVAIRAFYVVFKRVKLLQLTDLCVNFYVQFAHPFFASSGELCIALPICELNNNQAQ